MNKFIQRCLLSICLLDLLPFLMADHPECNNTDVCNCMNTARKNEYWCMGNNTNVIIEVKFDNTLKIICNGFVKTGHEYLSFLKGIEIMPKLERFILKQCPIPDISFANLFKTLNIQSTNEIQFESFLNISDGFKFYHFENLTQLESLYIWSNNITELPESIFQDMPNLKTLYLNNNALRVLPTKLFQSVPKLSKLELGSNNLANLENEVFQYVPNLESLSIYKNDLLNIRKNVFGHLTNLTSLDLSANNIKCLDDGVFDDLQRLKFLNLNYNNFSYLPRKLFAENRNLKVLRFMKACSDEMNTLPSGFFADLTSLSSVQMEANNFTELPGNLFQNCYNLTSITLKSNSLRTLPNTLFKDTTDLKELDISDNKLEYLNGTIFHSLGKLVKLCLEKNQLTYISSDVFFNFASLIELDLSYNNLVDFESDTFVGLENLKTINLGNNFLTFEHSSVWNFSPLHRCLKLETLDLRHNMVTKIFEDWKSVFTKLKTVNLSHNKLKNLSTEDLIFVSSNYPIMVDMSYNEIDTIFIQDLELYIKHQCDIAPCSAENSDWNLGETIFLLKNNPIRCDCEVFYLANYMQRKMFPMVYQMVNIKSEQVFCNSPDSLRNTSLSRLDLRDLQCSMNQVDLLQSENCPNDCSCRYRPVDKCIIVDCNGLGMSEFPQKVPTLVNSNMELLFADNEFNSLDGLSKLLSLANVTKLSLSFNKLTNIDDLKIPNGLEVLELDNNEISSLNKSTIEKLNAVTSLTTITLHENPLQCNCDTKYLAIFLRSQIQYKQIPNLINITCKNSRQPIIDLSIDEICEKSFTNAILTSIMIFCILLSTVIACYRIYILHFGRSPKFIENNKLHMGNISQVFYKTLNGLARSPRNDEQSMLDVGEHTTKSISNQR